MQYQIQYQPAHAMATVHLGPNESVRAEAGAMISMSSNIVVQTQGRPTGGGGILGGLKRSLLGGESFFTNQFTASSGVAGQVILAPQLCGDLRVHELTQGETLLIQGSSYVAAPDTVHIDTKFQGFKGLFSGESLFFLSATGSGGVLLNAFGALEVLDLDGELIVDTGHLVAFTSGIQYTVGKASDGWIASYLSGEGLVLHMRGRGRLYLQSRNPHEYGKTVGRRLPARRG